MTSLTRDAIKTKYGPRILYEVYHCIDKWHRNQHYTGMDLENYVCDHLISVLSIKITVDDVKAIMRLVEF